MNKKSPLLLLLAVCFLCCNSCSTSNLKTYRETVHAEAKFTKNRKILVFLDGTANNVDSHTNVRRLYDLVLAQRRPDFLVYYDDGVGADRRKLTGGLAGYGFSRNMRQAYRFISLHYRPGDKIYLFGFSRGAFNALALSSMIDKCGLAQHKSAPAWDQMVKVKQRATRSISTDKEIKNITKLKRDETEKMVKSLYKIYRNKKHKRAPDVFRSDLDKFYARSATEVKGIKIEAIGIWDSIEGLGLHDAFIAVRSVEKNESHAAKGHQFHSHQPSENVRRVYHAMSRDERRAYYFPMVLKQAPSGTQEFKQVWFAGDHSDVGGGHSAYKDLAGISFNWMLKNIERDGLVPKNYRVYENHTARRHDLTNSGVFKLARVRGRKEAVISNPNTKFHPSVYERSQTTIPEHNRLRSHHRNPNGEENGKYHSPQ